MYRIFDYECKKCGKIEEYLITSDKITDRCKHCNATSANLIKLPSWSGTPNLSWSKWNNLNHEG